MSLVVLAGRAQAPVEGPLAQAAGVGQQHAVRVGVGAGAGQGGQEMFLLGIE